MNAPNRQVFGAWIGTKMIENLLDPKPEEIDLSAVYENMQTQYRYSNCPRALKISQHVWVVRRLYELDCAGQGITPDPAVVDWCEHHDDHEGIIGDTIDPLKQIVCQRTPVLIEIETKLDVAICQARGVEYPSFEVRQAVRPYDKLAATIEWLYCLHRPSRPWHSAIPAWLSVPTINALHWKARGH